MRKIEYKVHKIDEDETGLKIHYTQMGGLIEGKFVHFCNGNDDILYGQSKKFKKALIEFCKKHRPELLI